MLRHSAWAVGSYSCGPPAARSAVTKSTGGCYHAEVGFSNAIKSPAKYVMHLQLRRILHCKLCAVRHRCSGWDSGQPGQQGGCEGDNLMAIFYISEKMPAANVPRSEQNVRDFIKYVCKNFQVLGLSLSTNHATQIVRNCVKSCALFTYCRQENAIFSPHIHTTWEGPFSAAL